MTRHFSTEDYSRSIGLTAEQQEFNRIWKEMGPIQKGEKDLPYAAIGFKPAVRRVHQGQRGKVVPLSADRLVVKATEVNAVLLNRIPTNHWKGARQNRSFRFNLAEVPFTAFPGDGELHVAACEIPKQDHHTMYQADLSMNPKQDGQLFEEKQWSPNQLIPQPPELCAVYGGKFELRRGELYLDLVVNNLAYYRIPLEYVDNLELVAENQTIVENGAVLVRCTEAVTYGQAMLDKKDRGRFDRVSPPVVSATRKVPLLKMSLVMLDRLCQAAVLPQDDENRPEVLPMDNWAPQQLVEFKPNQFDQLRDLPGWEETVELWSDLRKSVGPGGDFYVLSPVPDSIEFDRCEDPSMGVKVLVFRDSDGDEIELEVPESAVILDSVIKEGAKVSHMSPIADFVPRRHYAGWEDVKDELGDAWPFVVDSFLRHAAIGPGELLRDDYSYLLPAKYVKGVIASSPVQYPSWIDFRNCEAYLDEEKGTIIPPVFSQTDWQDMLISCNGIGYDMEPTGDRVTQTPIKESRRRRNKADAQPVA